MTHQRGGPVDVGDRISELDIIRGFALFGVLWMNLYEHADLVVPADKIIRLAPDAVETTVNFASSWLMLGKAQALFSMLFGFGFALFLSRAETAGADGPRLYLRRIGFLLALGVAHATLLWCGDILNSYALMGFALMLTRRWPGWLLLAVGLPCTLLLTSIVLALCDALYPGQPHSWDVLTEAGMARRYVVFQTADYPRYVVEVVRSWGEVYGTPLGISYLGWIFGRFLIGSWLFRQGWLQHSARYAPQFRRWAAILLVAGLSCALIDPLLDALHVRLDRPWIYLARTLNRTSQLVLALGYAAGIVSLCQSRAWRRRLSGLGAAGQMALSNYLTQSFLYFFLLYGFGFGLLRYVGPSFCLVVALVFYPLQIAFSRWWLARYRFGPAEWIWRSFTYGTRPRLRREPPEAPADRRGDQIGNWRQSP